MRPVFHIVNFGCQMNTHDSDWLKKTLRLEGFPEAQTPEEADIVLINTCSVREKPEQKVYELISWLDSINPGILIGVGGCLAVQVGSGLFERSSSVRLLFNSDTLSVVPEELKHLMTDQEKRLNLISFPVFYTERKTVLPTKAEASAFVNIMQGCDNSCAYCIVPYVRGRQRSRHMEEILTECATLVEHGVKEITLLGQNVNSWAQDLWPKAGRKSFFTELLKALSKLDKLRRIRFTTSHPKDLSDDIISAFTELPKLCPHLHLPLQSGSDKILNAMGRKYDMPRYRALAAALRRARPDISITTDLIVGFPGETDQDFRDTLTAIKDLAFDASFSFKYNDRPGVPSASLPGKIAEKVKAERLAKLQELQTGFTSTALQRMVGLKTEVLLEKESRKQDAARNSWQGRDPHNYVVNVCLPQPHNLIGVTLPVHITEAKRHSLIGEPEIGI